MYQLVDYLTQKKVAPKNLIFTGKDSPWEVKIDSQYIQSKINLDLFKSLPSFESKYFPFIPIRDFSSFISLSEGITPLIKSKKNKENIYFKYESKNPTGSFKDRGSSVEITIAKEMNAKAVVLASTGNMAASCSCYAATAEIPCFIFVPEGTPPSKMAQVISFGGKIIQIKGSYNDAVDLAQKVAEEYSFYLAGDYAFRVEGQKTAAFEIVDQLFYEVPDIVIIPMGCGTNLTAYYKGFMEYKSLGLIDRIPQMIGIQSSNVSPIVESFEKRKKTIKEFEKTEPTVASAIAVSYPLDGIKALDAIYKTNGMAISVSDNEMLEAQYRLAREEGLFVETSSASSYAAIEKIKEHIDLSSKKIVCVLTGNGLKDPSPILKVAIKPPSIYPEIKNFNALYENHFFEGKNIVFQDKDTILFKKRANAKDVEILSLKLFSIRLNSNNKKMVVRKIDEFFKKGKNITLSDFQDIIQDVSANITKIERNRFEVKDFHIETSKDKIPFGRVSVYIEGKEIETEASGVGPVDAIINALKKAGNLEFSLLDYNVQIRSKGTDAVVFVELKLKKNGAVFIGFGTSPDIIQASIESFENAYNSFLNNEENN